MTIGDARSTEPSTGTGSSTSPTSEPARWSCGDRHDEPGQPHRDGARPCPGHRRGGFGRRPVAGLTLRRRAVVVPCGFGPVVQVDGRTYRRRSRRRGVGSSSAATLRCGSAVTSSSAQGSSGSRSWPRASSRCDPWFWTIGRPAGRRAPRPPRRRSRSVTWGNTARSVDLVQPGDVDTLLVVRENASPAGRPTWVTPPCGPVRVDGWAQAWVVPAGDDRDGRPAFGPQRTFMISLGVGAAMALVLAAMALLAGRGGLPRCSPRGRPRGDPGRRRYGDGAGGRSHRTGGGDPRPPHRGAAPSADGRAGAGGWGCGRLGRVGAAAPLARC